MQKNNSWCAECLGWVQPRAGENQLRKVATRTAWEILWICTIATCKGIACLSTLHRLQKVCLTDNSVSVLTANEQWADDASEALEHYQKCSWNAVWHIEGVGEFKLAHTRDQTFQHNVSFLQFMKRSIGSCALQFENLGLWELLYSHSARVHMLGFVLAQSIVHFFCEDESAQATFFKFAHKFFGPCMMLVDAFAWHKVQSVWFREGSIFQFVVALLYKKGSFILWWNNHFGTWFRIQQHVKSSTTLHSCKQLGVSFHCKDKIGL